MTDDAVQTSESGSPAMLAAGVQAPDFTLKSTPDDSPGPERAWKRRRGTA